MNQSVLTDTAMQSPLGTASVIGPKHSKWKRNLAADLLLTALIDAFSILVIFLLMSFSSTGEILFINKDTELPSAQKAEVLEPHPVVKLEEGRFILDKDKFESGDGLFNALLELRKKFNEARPGEEMPGVITVQADRRVKYETLNSVVVACAQAGFSDIRFAVLMK
jgi:biopolymer transport protein ExbD